MEPDQEKISTLRRISPHSIQRDARRYVGRFERSPDNSEIRAAEGGLRTKEKYKASSTELPLVSIVTVCLNSQKTIKTTIESVLSQTYDNIEYIIVDGGSTDGTLDIIRTYEYAIDYYISEPDKGLYEAMNKGLSVVSGDYILILNSDDWYTDDAVATLMQARSYTGCDIVSALAQYVDGDGHPTEVMRSMPFDASTRLRMPLRHETMLLPFWVYEDFGKYDESYKVIADFVFTINLYEAGLTHYEVPKPILYFRITGVSNDLNGRIIPERARLFRDQFPTLKPDEIDTLAAYKLIPKMIEPKAYRHYQDERFIDSLNALYEEHVRWRKAPHWVRCSVDWISIFQMQERPKVSVILPVFNAEKTLKVAIESALSQTLTNIEVICINDNSTDNSQSIIHSYIRKDARIKFLINNKNVGLGASRNRGIRASRGSYIFHLDPDDKLPPTALEKLYQSAIKYDSDMVKGEYIREQKIHGIAEKKPVRNTLVPEGNPIVNTNLAKTRQLLNGTEGHWSYLYRRNFALQVPYPTDLKMGQDSIFLVNALARARSVSLIPEIVYEYKENSFSAMNNFSFRKYLDAIEWRRRAWHVLRDFDLQDIGDRILLSYWNDMYFIELSRNSTTSELKTIIDQLRLSLKQAGVVAPSNKASMLVQSLFSKVIEGDHRGALKTLIELRDKEKKAENDAAATRKRNNLKIITFCSLDWGGAAIGSHRRISALIDHKVDAKLFSLCARSGRDYVQIFDGIKDIYTSHSGNDIWNKVRELSILPAKKMKGFSARELFSLAESVVDFRKFRSRFDDADVVHLHWVVGMFDYDNTDVLAEKPVVWTLADMNPFTGGCHYSEGCDNYINECQNCPLLGGNNELAHMSWKIKRNSYEKLKRLHIVCPSQWMAERVRRSSLLGDRPVHVIPNAFPVSDFVPSNKAVARIKLGLPADKKIVLFGADDLKNKRKGGELAVESLMNTMRRGVPDFELVLFGNGAIEAPFPVHNFGHVRNEEHLCLIYSAADIFLFPSLEDNAPLTVAESLLCGTPVVAFPVGNIPQLIDHQKNGFIARFGDIDDFSLGIEWGLKSGKKEALRRMVRSRTKSALYHNAELSAERHVSIYREAISG